MGIIKKIIVLGTCVYMALIGGVWAKTIIYVPQDDRPVDLAYTVSTAQAAGYTIYTPSQTILSGRSFVGDADALGAWVYQQAPKADAMVLSMDSLLYGGLVDSRKHNYSLALVKQRLQRIEKLHQLYPQIPIYVFSTVMRSPWAGGKGVEPDYYLVYGSHIYGLASGQAKMDKQVLSAAEEAQLFAHLRQVPLEYIQDWYERRAKNMQINEKLIEATQRGIFAYYCLGHDDHSQNTQSSLESAYLEATKRNIDVHSFGSFPGADQLGLLLITRVHNEFMHQSPKIKLLYSLGEEEDMLPRYDGQPLGNTLREHIDAMGGQVVDTDKPDILLAINTPFLRTAGEASTVDNIPVLLSSTKQFLQAIQQATQQQIPVSVVDVGFSNGADNTLLYGLYKQHLLYAIAAYNGWNTASNSIGFGIAQGVLSTHMSTDSRRVMLATQYLDNWAYQANVRDYISRMKMKMNRYHMKPYYADENRELESLATEQLQRYGRMYLGLQPNQIEVTFPWQRLFEVEVHIRLDGKAVDEINVRKKLRAARLAACRKQVDVAQAQVMAYRKAYQEAKAAMYEGEPKDHLSPVQDDGREGYRQEEMATSSIEETLDKLRQEQAFWEQQLVLAMQAYEKEKQIQVMWEEEEKAQVSRTWQVD